MLDASIAANPLSLCTALNTLVALRQTQSERRVN